ncbi:Hypothetical_protein [Hexamita inflata]|uniref:Hypothetical_protein n=1 Tax=Hexamita inflata TaxID=28002 RepID=A0AA86UGI7_9EUKA|nr:Hypothetical protein HINF_LOCUS44880 [Hexamita inflata]
MLFWEIDKYNYERKKFHSGIIQYYYIQLNPQQLSQDHKNLLQEENISPKLNSFKLGPNNRLRTTSNQFDQAEHELQKDTQIPIKQILKKLTGKSLQCFRRQTQSILQIQMRPLLRIIICINLRCGTCLSSKFKRMVKYERASVQMSEDELFASQKPRWTI